MTSERFGTSGIVLFREAFDWSGELVAGLSTPKAVWRDSTVQECAERAYRPSVRHSIQTNLSEIGPEWIAHHTRLNDSLIPEYIKQAGLSVPDKHAYESMQVLHYLPGDFFSEHVDMLTKDGWLRYLAVITYLSGCQGGYTIFNRQKVAIKPEPGAVLIYPATRDYPHSGGFVLAGHKYCLTTWLQVRNSDDSSTSDPCQ